ncbi:DUF2691 family protein [Metabacillus litoralis]|uniref:DUF2691 family protein n=1 Tax=Metabacillus litoralis TaxID=152268 RepID=A0A5C6W4F9_9BACI|nr:DUF2691 family protein [Metabacillus litoralis]TXC92816.1 DUF2691 family protein [Metabacillus litoralis]
MKRGISFELPNEYGTFLGDVLKPIDIATYSWKIGSGESYKIKNNELNNDLFPDNKKVIEGIDFKRLIENNRYYLIFVELQAHPKGRIVEINNYDEFLRSDCELVLLVVDSCYVSIYCRDISKLEILYNNVLNYGFKGVEYITNENDTRTTLSVW